MAGELHDTGSLLALEALTGHSSTSASTTYLMLLTSPPSDSSTLAGLSEYVATGYSRQAVTWGSAALNTSGIPQIANSGTITFGPFTTVSGSTISYCALVTVGSGTSGDIRCWWTLDVSRTPAVNDSVQFAANSLKITLD